VLRRHADAGIGHSDGDIAAAPLGGERDRAALRGELHCVGEQIQQDLAQAPLIGAHRRQAGAIMLRRSMPTSAARSATIGDGAGDRFPELDDVLVERELAGIDL